MKTKPQSLEARADRQTFFYAVFYVTLSWGVLSTSGQIEAQRDGDDMLWTVPWLTEFASHFALLIAALIIPFYLTRRPLSLENWKRSVPVYALCFLAFGVVHVLLMVAIRHVVFPVFLGEPYEFGLTNPSVWIYELRKDLMAFILLLAGFLTNRHISQLKLETEGARNEARETGRLTLKSGGRIIFLSADEVIWAKAAQNYVEIHTETGQHLVRMPLSNLEALLRDAGEGHVRTHRSYLVSRKAIREIVPTGDGDATVILTNGESLPTSRKYRPDLQVA